MDEVVIVLICAIFMLILKVPFLFLEVNEPKSEMLDFSLAREPTVIVLTVCFGFIL